ncbi:unnamed protein product, partial [Owenia fusiformis]
ISMMKCPNRFKLVKNECVLNETQLKVYCKIPIGNNNAQNIKLLVTKVIEEVFNIIGILYVKARSDGFMHCQFFVQFQNETFGRKIDHYEKILQESFPPVDSPSSGRFCTFEKDGTELPRANLVVGKLTTEGQSVTFETSHIPSANGRITSNGVRLCSSLYGFVSTLLVFALTRSTINQT